MKNFVLLLVLFMISFAQAARITDNNLKLGNSTTTGNKKIEFDTGLGTSNKKLEVDASTGDLTSNSNILNLGDGTASDKKIILNRGGSNAAIKWEESTGKLKFSKDGTLYKELGTGGSGGDSGINLLTNAGFEDPVSTGWSNTGGTFSSLLYSNPPDGNLSYARFVATASGQYVDSALMTVPTNVTGGCVAYTKYKQGGSAFKIQVIDSSANLLTESAVLPDLASWPSNNSIVAFPCPAAASQYKVRFISTAAGTLDWDSVYSGPENRVVRASPDTGWKSCGHTTSSFNGFGTVASIEGQCKRMGSDLLMRGKFTVGTATAVEARINLPVWNGVQLVSSGTSDIPTVQVAGQIGTNATANSYQALISPSSTFINIGANVASGSGVFTLMTGSGIFGTCVGCQVGYTVRVPIAGWDSLSAEAVNVEAQDWMIDVNIGGALASTTSTVTSYVELTNASLDMVLAPGSAVAKIPCSGTNVSTGLTCSSGSEGIGAVFTAPSSGAYEVCLEAGAYLTSSSTMTVELVETPAGSQTILQEGKSRAGQSNGVSAGTVVYPLRTCGTFYFAAAGEKTIRVMVEGTGAGGWGIIADRDGSTGQRDIHLVIKQLMSANNRPYFLPYPKSEVYVTGGSGHGSTNTKIRRFTTTVKAIGTDITNSGDDSVNGHSFTINTDGVYSISYCDGNALAGTQYGVSVSSNQLTTAIQSITEANRLVMSTLATANAYAQCMATTVNLSKGDVVRAHDEGTNAQTTNYLIGFRITKVSN